MLARGVASIGEHELIVGGLIAGELSGGTHVERPRLIAGFDAGWRRYDGVAQREG